MVLCGAALLGGCSDSEIHIDKVRAALQGLPPEQEARVEESLADIAANNYGAALKPLRALALGAKLDETQRKIIQDTVLKVKLKAEKQQ
jgi:hypothetical protein